MELDHVFCFVPPGFPGEADLAAHGCNIGFGRAHPGQGTENRLLLFDNAYVELIWIRDLQEAANNPLRLDRRWAPGGVVGCPFGIGLRGTIPGALRSGFFEYRLEGLPGKLWIHRESNEDGMLPLLFVIEADGAEPARSTRDHGFPSGLFTHPNGAHLIERVTVMGPGIEDLPIPVMTPRVDRWPDDRWRMDVEVASKVHEAVEVVPGFNLLLRKR